MSAAVAVVDVGVIHVGILIKVVVVVELLLILLLKQLRLLLRIHQWSRLLLLLEEPRLGEAIASV